MTITSSTMPAVRIAGVNPTGVLAFVTAVDGEVIRVRCRAGRPMPWVCDQCGAQSEPRCAHAIATRLGHLALTQLTTR